MKLLENNRSAGYDSIDRARSTLTDIRYILGEDLPVSSDLCDVPFPLEIPVLESVNALLDALNQLSETQSLTPGDHPSSLSQTKTCHVCGVCVCGVCACLIRIR